jgi:murein DD-endopeptidase MepM/ murein hydrolase activator NlpD
VDHQGIRKTRPLSRRSREGLCASGIGIEVCDICVPARAEIVTQFIKVGALLATIFLLGGCAHRSGASGAGEPQSHEEPDLVGRRHIVAPGETLFRVAKAYGVSPEALAAENGIQDPRTLAVGQDLIIPDPESGAPAEPEPPAMPVNKEKERPASLVRGRGASTDPRLRGDLEWPLRGVLYTRFGRKGRDVHDGIDLAAPLGTPIRAARSGTVIYAGEQRGYGLIAIIEHANGLTTLYAHNRELKVKTGQRVSDGQVIATVGESGRTTGPHLHFEVRKEGVPVDPLDHLGAIPR